MIEQRGDNKERRHKGLHRQQLIFNKFSIFANILNRNRWNQREPNNQCGYLNTQNKDFIFVQIRIKEQNTITKTKKQINNNNEQTSIINIIISVCSCKNYSKHYFSHHLDNLLLRFAIESWRLKSIPCKQSQLHSPDSFAQYLQPPVHI